MTHPHQSTHQSTHHRSPRRRAAAGIAAVITTALTGIAALTPAQADQPAPTPTRAPVLHPTSSAALGQTVDFYRQWKKLYIQQKCGPGQLVLNANADGGWTGGGASTNTLTVSEAHGYAMMLTVLMAEHDPQAQATFNGLTAYFHAHPARSNPGLMAWNQTPDCRDTADPEIDGTRSATDGDLDIAYAFILADRAWGSTGQINYAAEARRVLAAVLAEEVEGDVLLVGDWARDPGQEQYRSMTRTSDFMVSHLATFAQFTGDKRWLALRDRMYATVSTVTAAHSPRTGLVPDVVVGMPRSPRPARAGFFEGEFDGSYAYNAVRYPWRLSLDAVLNDEPRSRQAMSTLNAWAQTSTGGNPTRWATVYRLDGTPVADQGTNSMVSVPMIGVAAMTDGGTATSARSQRWLDALWGDVAGTRMAEGDYYTNTLKLLGMVTLSGQWERAARR